MKADLHVHTEFSWDSKVPISLYLKRAKDKGIHIISFTDHNDTQSHELIKNIDTDIILVPGQEINTLEGHLLVYGWIPTVTRDLSMKESVAKARQMGEEFNCKVVCIAAHPYDFLRSGAGDAILDSGVDGVEIINASSLFEYFNWKAKRKTKHIDFAKLGNSDSHRIDEFAMAYNDFPDCTTVDEVLDAIPIAVARGHRIGIIRKANRFFRRKLGLMTV